MSRLKKSESLEIRIPYPTKQAFMDRCRRDGRTASQALREMIDQDLAATGRPGSRKVLRLLIGAAVAAAVGAVAVPSLARPGPAEEFRRLDTDHDGRLSLAEYSRRQVIVFPAP